MDGGVCKDTFTVTVSERAPKNRYVVEINERPLMVLGQQLRTVGPGHLRAERRATQ